MIPSLRAGRYRRQPRSAITWSMTCSSWQRAADRVGLGGGDPELLGAVLQLARLPLGRREPAVELVDVAHVADEVEEEGDQAAIEVREVDPGAEDAPPGVARVVDDAAAEDADLDLGIEQDEVDRGLGRGQRGGVLGVEVARVAQLEDPRDAVAAHVRAAEVDLAAACAARRGARARASVGRSIAHTRCDPARGEASTCAMSRPCAISTPSFSPCRCSASASTSRARGDEPREALGGAVDQLVEAQRRGVVVGQGRVELLGVLAQEALARVVVGPLEVLYEHAPMLCEREKSPARRRHAGLSHTMRLLRVA